MSHYKKGAWVEPESCECKIWPCQFHTPEQHKCEYMNSGKPSNCLENIDETEVAKKAKQLFRGV